MPPALQKAKNPGCLPGLLRMFGFGNKSEASNQALEPDTQSGGLPYHLRDDFLSAAEASFYQVIKGMMGNYLTICPKMALSELLYVPRGNDNFPAFQNKIDRKRIDFLVCDAKTMRPRFAIELDDPSHQRPDRVERDEFVEHVFEAAGLPLVRIPVKNAYDTRELGETFKKALGNGNQQPQPAQPAVTTESDPEPPICPQCGARMVLREARRGAKMGSKFYGCPNYPQCKAILPLKT